MYFQQSYCHPSQQQQQQQMMMMGGGGGGVDYCGGMGQHHYLDPSDPSGSGGSHLRQDFSLDDLNFDPAYMMDNNGADDLAVNVFYWNGVLYSAKMHGRSVLMGSNFIEDKIWVKNV